MPSLEGIEQAVDYPFSHLKMFHFKLLTCFYFENFLTIGSQATFFSAISF